MSLLPFISDAFGHAFGHGLHPEQIYPTTRQSNLLNTNLWPGIYPPQWSAPQQNLGQAANLKKFIGKDGFQVCIDVHHFQPNEITVKTVDNSVVVEGTHEEKEDEHGHIHRHFTRRYELPEQFDVKDVVSSLSSDGVLTIKAPPKAKAIESNERVVEIQLTGPAHLSIKRNEKTEKDEATGGETMTE